MTQINADPVIDEIREARRNISERVGHNPVGLVDYYIQLQKQYRERLLPSSGPKTSTDKPAT